MSMWMWYVLGVATPFIFGVGGTLLCFATLEIIDGYRRRYQLSLNFKRDLIESEQDFQDYLKYRRDKQYGNL